MSFLERYLRTPFLFCFSVCHITFLWCNAIASSTLSSIICSVKTPSSEAYAAAYKQTPDLLKLLLLKRTQHPTSRHHFCHHSVVWASNKQQTLADMLKLHCLRHIVTYKQRLDQLKPHQLRGINLPTNNGQYMICYNCRLRQIQWPKKRHQISINCLFRGICSGL